MARIFPQGPLREDEESPREPQRITDCIDQPDDALRKEEPCSTRGRSFLLGKQSRPKACDGLTASMVAIGCDQGSLNGAIGFDYGV